MIVAEAFTPRRPCSRVTLAIPVCCPLARLAPGKAAESAFSNLILACLLLRRFGIRSRHSTPHGSQRPFRVEHVVSLQPGVGLLRDPLPAAPSHALQRADPSGPSAQEDNGFTEFHGDDTVGWVLPFYRRYSVSVSRIKSETSDRLPFWLRRLQLLSPAYTHGSYNSSLTFTRPPSLAPYPPCSWQTPEPILTNPLCRLRGGTLSGRFRRFLTDSATAPRLWVTEHPVSSAPLASRRADHHRRGFTPPKKYQPP